ncbi:hypothetical protein [Dechloromonas sp. HYN0024]|uniref:hypothetical protein n=1 Tax=Dechloromonas sp. HYN0024 TaxID=2231055 RepID=UPI000E44C3E8|nr:hypothetical protein [Dechloromonas sp. HYN0024]AXS80635.1 hypothetical protein HYN24_11755 [Dechloromonas sp. HYN0024]
MTRLAAPAIIESPCCQSKLLQQRFASINTFGLATRWSDGYTDIFLAPEAGSLACCPACTGIFWVEDARELGRAPTREPESLHWGWPRRLLAHMTGHYEGLCAEEKTWQAFHDEELFITALERPRPAEILNAVQRGKATTPAREIYLRTRLWWIGNHRQRGRRIENPMTLEQTEDNMRSLLALHKASNDVDSIAVTVGELLRQLGRFDEAVAVLENVALEPNLVAVMLRLAKQRKSEICAIEQF